MDREKLLELLMDREKLMEIIDSNGRFNLPTVELELLADHLIANGIGDITAEKHRADRAEEALDLAYEEWTCCDSCMFSVDCKTNRTDCKKAEISKIKQQAAEQRLKELQGEVEGK